MSYTCLWNSDGPAFTDHFKGDLSNVRFTSSQFKLLIFFLVKRVAFPSQIEEVFLYSRYKYF